MALATGTASLEMPLRYLPMVEPPTSLSVGAVSDFDVWRDTDGHTSVSLVALGPAGVDRAKVTLQSATTTLTEREWHAVDVKVNTSADPHILLDTEY